MTTESSSAAKLMALTSDDPQVKRAYAYDIRTFGHVMNVTRATVASPVTWQAAARSQHMFVTLRRVDERMCALLCAYTSMLSGCEYCLDDAAGAALKLGVTPGALLALPETADEQLEMGLRLAREIALDARRVGGALVREARAVMGEERFLEVVAVVSMKCFWNRLAITLGIPPEGHCEDRSLLSALCARGRELNADHVSS